MNLLTNTAAFIFALGVIIFVHELGHFLAAKSVGDILSITDMPGTAEAGDGLDRLAVDEAKRAHIVIYVTDGDLNRQQHAQLQELIALDTFAMINAQVLAVIMKLHHLLRHVHIIRIAVHATGQVAFFITRERQHSATQIRH